MQTLLDAYFASIDAIAFTQLVEEECIAALHAEDVAEGLRVVSPSSDKPKRARESMYVRMFNEMIDTVLGQERYLFTDEECRLIEKYRDLPYGSRYLLIRLMLRKAEKWHRSDVLRKAYEADIPNVSEAMEDLCRGSRPSRAPNGQEFITIDDSDDEDDVDPPNEVDYFAQDDAELQLGELMECLLGPELRLLAKNMKVTLIETRKADIISAILTHAENQGTLDFFKRPINQLSRLRTMVKKTTGRCIRLNGNIRSIFQRINLVFFRSTELQATLLPLILSNTRIDNPSHRHYPSYTPTRTISIFPTRESLLNYERALTIEKDMEEALAGDSRFEGAKQALLLFKPAHVRWTKLMEELDAGGDAALERPGALERFHEGHVLTRVVYKGAFACGITKQYYEEELLLRSLLSQERWRNGRRGAWYDRLALICTNYKNKSTEDFEEAIQVLRDGLKDPYTHLIYRPALENRLKRLENKLKISPEERYHGTTKLKRPEQILITGRRIIPLAETSTSSNSNAILGKSTDKKRGVSVSTNDKRAKSTAVRVPTKGKENKDASWKTTGKSVWRGKDGVEVNVEELALEHYETLGYKGFHAEGRITLHMYTLLFWPILFDSSIPGSFETRFQSSPLDLVHDTFFPSRKDAIERRLQEIEDGKGLEYIRETDERERPHKTWAVGVRWDDFALQDVLEIAEGLGGKALGVICRLLSEEYSCRASGVPDLIIWNAETKESKFVEVKGPGDQLSNNQRVWIDVMMRHGIAVEVCRVENWDYKPKRKQSESRKSVSRQPEPEDSEPEEEDHDYDQMDTEDVKPVIEPSPGPSVQTRKRPRSEVAR